MDAYKSEFHLGTLLRNSLFATAKLALLAGYNHKCSAWKADIHANL